MSVREREARNRETVSEMREVLEEEIEKEIQGRESQGEEINRDRETEREKESEDISSPYLSGVPRISVLIQQGVNHSTQ